MRQPFIKLISLLVALLGLSTALVVGVGFVLFLSFSGVQLPNLAEGTQDKPVEAGEIPVVKALVDPASVWEATDWSVMDKEPNAEELNYGKELVANTAEYLGPKGKVKTMSNGMNCQNCHLDAGTKIFGNNYSAVASTYPKFRARSGAIENIYKRVNDCFERSLNGTALDTNSREMQGITAYIKWLGKDVKKGVKPAGSGFKDLALLDRAADSEKGKLIYTDKCQSCHQSSGLGLMNGAKTAYTYPPLWGEHSYNDGAGLFRMSNFAKYVKYNMPLGANHNSPQLTDEEAWDVAAFANSQTRPHKNIKNDWPKIEEKPFDHPFGPYADGFDEKQHKYGPFKPIKDKMFSICSVFQITKYFAIRRTINNVFERPVFFNKPVNSLPLEKRFRFIV